MALLCIATKKSSCDETVLTLHVCKRRVGWTSNRVASDMNASGLMNALEHPLSRLTSCNTCSNYAVQCETTMCCCYGNINTKHSSRLAYKKKLNKSLTFPYAYRNDSSRVWDWIWIDRSLVSKSIIKPMVLYFQCVCHVVSQYGQ